jgi:hypothetical protein
MRQAAPSPFIRLDESWELPERHLSAANREALAEARSVAEEIGPVTTESQTPQLHELPALIDAALAMDRRLAPDDPAAALNRAVFWRQYGEGACIAGGLRVARLRIGDRVAAMQVAVESRGAFWSLLAGHDERFAACAPSRLLARETIRYAAEAALDFYEFWEGAPRECDLWTNQSRQCVSLAVYPLNPSGLGALAVDAALAGWRRICKRQSR